MHGPSAAPILSQDLSVSDGSHQGLKSGPDSILGTYCQDCVPPPISDAVVERFYLQSVARDLLPDERVSDCLRKLVPGKQRVEIVADAARHVAHYRNLVTCGRVWLCPVCAAKITERRAADLLQAVTRWQDGGFVALVTFTLRHSSADPLKTLVEALRASHRRFKSGAPYRRIADRYHWSGSVTALEVTHGENGWHPHLHELVFFGPVAADRWRLFPDVVKERWSRVLAAEGRDASWLHGVDVRDAESDVYEYVAKFGKLPTGSRWTIEREVAKAASKRASRDGRAPFALLAAAGAGDVVADDLFCEYAAAFKGRNQLVWSRGLRSLLEMDTEAADGEIAAALPDPYVVLASLSRAEWRAVLSLPRDVRGDLLVVAARGDGSQLRDYLRRIQVG